MATATAAAKGPKEFSFSWEGKDKTGKTVRGELRAPGEAMVNATLRRQGIVVSKVKKQSSKKGGSILSNNAKPSSVAPALIARTRMTPKKSFRVSCGRGSAAS